MNGKSGIHKGSRMQKVIRTDDGLYIFGCAKDRRSSTKRVIELARLDSRQIRRSMSTSDWVKFKQACIRYKVNPNRLVSSLIKFWMHSKDGREYGYTGQK